MKKTPVVQRDITAAYVMPAPAYLQRQRACGNHTVPAKVDGDTKAAIKKAVKAGIKLKPSQPGPATK